MSAYCFISSGWNADNGGRGTVQRSREDPRRGRGVLTSIALPVVVAAMRVKERRDRKDEMPYDRGNGGCFFLPLFPGETSGHVYSTRRRAFWKLRGKRLHHPRFGVHRGRSVSTLFPQFVGTVALVASRFSNRASARRNDSPEIRTQGEFSDLIPWTR